MKQDNNLSMPLSRTLKIGGLEAKNRFCIQPMECGNGDLKGGFTKDTLRRYEDLFRGGAGVVVMESVTLQYESRAREHQLLLDVEDLHNRKMWESFVKEMKAKYPDPIFIVQLNHSGELSDTAFSKRVCVKPRKDWGGELLDSAYVDKTIEKFAEAAKFLYEIGCDGVDLKFCHGYLGTQILRPYNDRIWKYGGSWENRSRFAFDMCEKVSKAVNTSKFLIGAKVSLYEGMAGGQGHAGADSEQLNLEETFALCRGLEERGASFFIETLGNAETADWQLMCPNKNTSENVYRHMAMAQNLKRGLRPETTVICGGLSLLAEGRFNENHQISAEKNGLLHWGNYCIEKGSFDMIALGRQSFADPFLPKKYLEGIEKDINWCLCCDGCGGLLAQQKPVECVIYNK